MEVEVLFLLSRAFSKFTVPLYNTEFREMEVADVLVKMAILGMKIW